MKTTQKARETLHRLLVAFEQGTVSDALAHTCIPPLDIPSSRWSFNNRLLVFLADTADARGIGQWKQAGRWPRKGSKAFYILAPLTARQKVEDEQGETQERAVTVGFKAVPVFRLEDTDGKPVDYPPTIPAELPPLIDVAQSWGVKVRYAPRMAGHYGYFTPGEKKEIVLCTHDEDVFFHELAHAAHERLRGRLEGGQHWDQEIVAELSAATLMHQYGRHPQDGRAYQYIRGYAQKAGKNPHQACLSVLDQVQQILNLIIQSHREPAAEAA